MNKELGERYWWPNNFHCQGEKLEEFWKKYLTTQSRKILYILGRGFDSRMNLGISKLCNINQDSDLSCIVLHYIEGSNSPPDQNEEWANQNLSELRRILGPNVLIKEVKLQGPDSNYKVQGRHVADYLASYDLLSSFTDVVVDISALPRNIYFPLINQLIKQCEAQNLHVIVAENSHSDSIIHGTEFDEVANYMFSFSGEMELEAQNDLPIVWFPVIGEGKFSQLKIIYRTLKDVTNNPNTIEICPIFPFPAKNPRRVDNLISEYHILLLEEFEVDPRNIIHADEKNPFDVYRQITDAAKLYDEAFKPLGGCRKVVSVLASKLLSLGALIAANDGQMAVAYVPAQSYIIEAQDVGVSPSEPNILHEVWLLGEPYQV